MIELVRLRVNGVLLAVGAWIAAAFVVFVFEILLAIVTIPDLAAPLRRFRERRHRALSWGHDLMHPAGA